MMRAHRKMFQLATENLSMYDLSVDENQIESLSTSMVRKNSLQKKNRKLKQRKISCISFFFVKCDPFKRLQIVKKRRQGKRIFFFVISDNYIHISYFVHVTLDLCCIRIVTFWFCKYSGFFHTQTYTVHTHTYSLLSSISTNNVSALFFFISNLSSSFLLFKNRKH